MTTVIRIYSMAQRMTRTALTQLILLVFAFIHFNGKAQDVVWHDVPVSPEAYHADFDLLVSMLKRNHGGIYRYTDAESFNEKVETLRNFTDNNSLADAFLNMVLLVDEIKDGHTVVMPSEDQARAILWSHAFIPFTITVTGVDMHIEANFSDCHDLVPGTKLLEIDGMPVRTIVKELLPFFTADGLSLSGKLGGLESQFWWFYGLRFGFKSKHDIWYSTAHDKRKHTVIKSLRMNDRINDINEVYDRFADDDQAVQWHADAPAAYLKVSSFNAYSLRRYRRMFEHALNDFKEANCSHLVIDVRGNGGGREGVENLLISCLGQHCHDKYDEVIISCPSTAVYRHFRKGWLKRIEDTIYRTVEFRRNDADEWERRERYKRTFFNPKHPFTGPVAVLIDRNTFSGASEFAALVRDNIPNATLIGEETCGGYQGHTSGYSYELVLPNTGFIVHIPRVWFDLNVPGDHLGGVLPHYSLQNPPSKSDEVLDFALSGGWVTHEATTKE